MRSLRSGGRQSVSGQAHTNAELPVLLAVHLTIQHGKRSSSFVPLQTSYRWLERARGRMLRAFKHAFKTAQLAQLGHDAACQRSAKRSDVSLQ